MVDRRRAERSLIGSGAGPAGAVPEVPFRLEINGHPAGAWTCSPGDLEALALGWLLAEGYLDRPGTLPALEPFEDGDGVHGVRARLPASLAARGDAERRHRHEQGCGPLHFVTCAPGSLRAAPGAPPDAEASATLFRTLFAAAAAHREVGGIHSAALVEGSALRFQVDEVGRHNAVDKTIGLALLAGRDPAGLGLILTARISAGIAVKAARAGLAWVASRSVPTTLAVRVAAAAGLPLVARAAGKERRIHLPAPEPTA